MLIQIPANAIICHYVELNPGQWAVITPSHKVLASSFYELRNQYQFHSSINGAGAWVVLIPRSSSFSQATQQALF